MRSGFGERLCAVPGSLWIAVGALGLMFLNQVFLYVVTGGTGLFLSVMLIGILLAGLLCRQSWAFPMTIVLFVLWVLVGLQAWPGDKLMAIKNAIVGGFVLVPVLLNRDWIAPESGEDF